MKVTCDRVYSLLMDFVEASLPADAQNSVRKHMADCPACTRLLETFDKTRTLCHDFLSHKLPDGAGDKLLTALRDTLKPRR